MPKKIITKIGEILKKKIAPDAIITKIVAENFNADFFKIERNAAAINATTAGRMPRKIRVTV